MKRRAADKQQNANHRDQAQQREAWQGSKGKLCSLTHKTLAGQPCAPALHGSQPHAHENCRVGGSILQDEPDSLLRVHVVPVD